VKAPGPRPCAIGIDLGTSGCRAVALSDDGMTLGEARTPLPHPLRDGQGGSEQEPSLWWEAVIAVLRDLAPALVDQGPPRVCVDATSATVLLATPAGVPLGPALMYDDSRSRSEAARIVACAPVDSPALGASSSLAKALHLHRHFAGDGPHLVLHQADWVLGRLTGCYGVSDWNNCLKLGFDLAGGAWPAWLRRLNLDGLVLPKVLAPGATVAPICPGVLAATGLAPGGLAVAGTTDSTAAVIATGAWRPGDAVTCLGSTLVLKVMGEQPVSASRYGVYSHRLRDSWLIGGASNTGGAVLRRYFDDESLRRLGAGMDPERSTGLDYYPLLARGERFPFADPGFAPRLTPRPEDDRVFLQGMFEGMARIEAKGYALLHDLGAPAVRRVLTIGGGAVSPAWTRIREQTLGVPVVAAPVQEAAFGAAQLAVSEAGGRGLS
jgi:D-ribulokinase